MMRLNERFGCLDNGLVQINGPVIKTKAHLFELNPHKEIYDKFDVQGESVDGYHFQFSRDSVLKITTPRGIEVTRPVAVPAPLDIACYINTPFTVLKAAKKDGIEYALVVGCNDGYHFYTIKGNIDTDDFTVVPREVVAKSHPEPILSISRIPCFGYGYKDTLNADSLIVCLKPNPDHNHLVINFCGYDKPRVQAYDTAVGDRHDDGGRNHYISSISYCVFPAPNGEWSVGISLFDYCLSNYDPLSANFILGCTFHVKRLKASMADGAFLPELEHVLTQFNYHEAGGFLGVITLGMATGMLLERQALYHGGMLPVVEYKETAPHIFHAQVAWYQSMPGENMDKEELKRYIQEHNELPPNDQALHRTAHILLAKEGMVTTEPAFIKEAGYEVQKPDDPTGSLSSNVFAFILSVPPSAYGYEKDENLAPKFGFIINKGLSMDVSKDKTSGSKLGGSVQAGGLPSGCAFSFQSNLEYTGSTNYRDVKTSSVATGGEGRLNNPFHNMFLIYNLPTELKIGIMCGSDRESMCYGAGSLHKVFPMTSFTIDTGKSIDFKYVEGLVTRPNAKATNPEIKLPLTKGLPVYFPGGKNRDDKLNKGYETYKKMLTDIERLSGENMGISKIKDSTGREISFPRITGNSLGNASLDFNNINSSSTQKIKESDHKFKIGNLNFFAMGLHGGTSSNFTRSAQQSETDGIKVSYENQVKQSPVPECRPVIYEVNVGMLKKYYKNNRAIFYFIPDLIWERSESFYLIGFTEFEENS